MAVVWLFDVILLFMAGMWLFAVVYGSYVAAYGGPSHLLFLESTQTAASGNTVYTTAGPSAEHTHPCGGDPALCPRDSYH